MSYQIFVTIANDRQFYSYAETLEHAKAMALDALDTYSWLDPEIFVTIESDEKTICTINI